MWICFRPSFGFVSGHHVDLFQAIMWICVSPSCGFVSGHHVDLFQTIMWICFRPSFGFVSAPSFGFVSGHHLDLFQVHHSRPRFGQGGGGRGRVTQGGDIPVLLVLFLHWVLFLTCCNRHFFFFGPSTPGTSDLMSMVSHVESPKLWYFIVMMTAGSFFFTLRCRILLAEWIRIGCDVTMLLRNIGCLFKNGTFWLFL